MGSSSPWFGIRVFAASEIVPQIVCVVHTRVVFRDEESMGPEHKNDELSTTASSVL